MEEILQFFDSHPDAFPLYDKFEKCVMEHVPEARIKVQKTQISFYNRHRNSSSPEVPASLFSCKIFHIDAVNACPFQHFATEFDACAGRHVFHDPGQRMDLFLLPGQFPDRAVSHDAAVGAGLNDVPEHVRIFYFPFIQTHFSRFMKFPFFCYYQRNIVKIMRIKIITKMICPNRSDPICISSNSFG